MSVSFGAGYYYVDTLAELFAYGLKSRAHSATPNAPIHYSTPYVGYAKYEYISNSVAYGAIAQNIKVGSVTDVLLEDNGHLTYKEDGKLVDLGFLDVRSSVYYSSSSALKLALFYKTSIAQNNLVGLNALNMMIGDILVGEVKSDVHYLHGFASWEWQGLLKDNKMMESANDEMKAKILAIKNPVLKRVSYATFEGLKAVNGFVSLYNIADTLDTVTSVVAGSAALKKTSDFVKDMSVYFEVSDMGDDGSIMMVEGGALVAGLGAIAEVAVPVAVGTAVLGGTYLGIKKIMDFCKPITETVKAVGVSKFIADESKDHPTLDKAIETLKIVGGGSVDADFSVEHYVNKVLDDSSDGVHYPTVDSPDYYKEPDKDNPVDPKLRLVGDKELPKEEDTPKFNVFADGGAVQLPKVTDTGGTDTKGKDNTGAIGQTGSGTQTAPTDTKTNENTKISASIITDTAIHTGQQTDTKDKVNTGVLPVGQTSTDTNTKVNTPDNTKTDVPTDTKTDVKTDGVVTSATGAGTLAPVDSKVDTGEKTVGTITGTGTGATGFTFDFNITIPGISLLVDAFKHHTQVVQEHNIKVQAHLDKHDYILDKEKERFDTEVDNLPLIARENQAWQNLHSTEDLGTYEDSSAVEHSLPKGLVYGLNRQGIGGLITEILKTHKNSNIVDRSRGLAKAEEEQNSKRDDNGNILDFIDDIFDMFPKYKNYSIQKLVDNGIIEKVEDFKLSKDHLDTLKHMGLMELGLSGGTDVDGNRPKG